MEYKNAVGRKVARIRYQCGMSQSELARELQKTGWDITRSGVSKIEARSQVVKDWQMMFLVRVLATEHERFYPWIDPKDDFFDAFCKIMKRKG